MSQSAWRFANRALPWARSAPSKQRISGRKTDGERPAIWARATPGLQKLDALLYG
jgi:hypothetical protein